MPGKVKLTRGEHTARDLARKRANLEVAFEGPEGERVWVFSDPATGEKIGCWDSLTQQYEFRGREGTCGHVLTLIGLAAGRSMDSPEKARRREQKRAERAARRAAGGC